MRAEKENAVERAETAETSAKEANQKAEKVSSSNIGVFLRFCDV